jgi:hypothetical protein
MRPALLCTGTQRSGTSGPGQRTMVMVMSAWFHQSSTASSQAPTGGRLASMYQADRLALGAIDPSLVMTPSFFMNEISFQSVVCQKADLLGADGNALVLSPTVSI